MTESQEMLLKHHFEWCIMEKDYTGDINPVAVFTVKVNAEGWMTNLQAEFPRSLFWLAPVLKGEG